MMKIRTLFYLTSWFIIGIFLFLWLEQHQTYHYAYLEQFRLFHYSSDYLLDLLCRPCGGIEYLATFFIQYFDHRYVGAFVHTLLFLLTGISLQRLWEKIVPASENPLVYLLPGILLILAGMNTNYHLEGSLAFVLTLLLLNLYLCFKRPVVREIFALTASWFLFHLTGPAFIIFLATILLHDWHTNSFSRKRSLLLVVLAFIPAIYWFLADNGETARIIFLPDAYNHPRTELHPIVYAIWFSLPGLLILAYICQGYTKKLPRWIKGISISLQLLAAIGLLHYGNQTYNPARIYLSKKMDYHSRRKETDELLLLPLRPNENTLHACYQNLALAQKGILADKALKYKQSGSKGLWIEWNPTATICTLLSDLYYTMGHIALSQRYAFEGMIASERAVNPYLTLRLIQTNLIYGQYRVAEKYIRLLEDTRYHEQAMGYQKFLDNDQAIQEDLELGSRRQCIAQTKGLSEISGLPNDLLQIANSHPGNRTVLSYIGMYILFEKDIPMFRKFLGTYHQAEGLQPMPIHFQEAVILSCEAQPELWEAYGVTETTRKRFEEFRKLLISNKKNPSLGHKLRTNYGDTYWYYYIYNK